MPLGHAKDTSRSGQRGDLMRALLDDECLNGPEVHVSFRPERVAIPVAAGTLNEAVAAIESECQVWGGAATPLIPVSPEGMVVDAYARILPGAAIDHVVGLDRRALGAGGTLRPGRSPATGIGGGPIRGGAS